MNKIKISAYPLDKKIDACAHYRILSPLGHLNNSIDIYWNEDFSLKKITEFTQNAQQADIILIQRFFPSRTTATFIDYLFSLNKPVIYEIDDLLTEIPSDNPNHKWSLARRNLIHSTIKRASAVTVSTTRLKNHFVKYNKNIFILPNFIDTNLLQNERQKKYTSNEICIGYTGSPTHYKDLQIIEEALFLISSRYSNNVSFIFFGCNTGTLKSLPNSVFIDHEKSYHSYVKILKKLHFDILLIPLAESAFNNAKSNIKWLEYSALGIPGIYSKVRPYTECITNPSLGLLADNTTKDWIRCISMLIEDQSLREAISNSARSEVLARHDISRHAHKWLAAYRSVIKHHALTRPQNTSGNSATGPTADILTIVSFHISGTRHSSQFLRQIAPLHELEKIGKVRIINGHTLLRRNGPSLSLDTTALPQCTIVFLQRDFSAYEFLFETGLPLIYDLDDNLLELPAKHPDMQQYQKLSALLKKYLHRFAAVMVPTENMRRLCATYNPNTRVIPNFIPLIPARFKTDGRKIRILLSGTHSHLQDAAFLVPVIEDICLRYPDTVEFFCWGYCPDELRQHPNIRVLDTFINDYPSYLHELASLHADIGLIPLAITEFNSFKSDIKWKEYAICGIVSIATDSAPYQTIRHGKDGYLADNAPQTWKELLVLLIEDTALRRRVADTAARRIHADFLLSNNLHLLEEALRSLPAELEQKAPPEISIIIPVFNKKDLTQNCLQTLFSISARHTYEVIVIDNASTDGTHKLLREHFPACRTLTNPDNLGFAAACNQGATAARGKFLVFLNNDTIPLPGWIDNLAETLHKHPAAGIVGCKLLYPDNTIQHCGASMKHDGSCFRHQYKFLPCDHQLANIERELDAVTAACCITPRALFHELGMFDTAYRNGCEDMDYCSKVRQAGYKIFYTPRSVLLHLESQTQRPENRDRENFELYLSRWGSEFMKNEMEIYAEDGFWADKGGVLHPTASELLTEFSTALKNATILKDTKTISRYKKIIERIYPVQTWSKMRSYKRLKCSERNNSKVLFICHDFPPHKYAGAQLYAKHLAEEINAKNLANIEIIYPVVRKKEKQDYEIITINTNKPVLHEIYKPCVDEPDKIFDDVVFKKFSSFLKSTKYDIIHFHGLGQLSLAPIFSADELNIPSIITLHDYWFLCDRWHMIKHDQSLCSGPDSIEKCAICFLQTRNMDMKQIKLALNYQSMRKSYMKKAFSKFAHRYAPSKFLADTFAKFGFSDIEIAPLGLSSLPQHTKLKTTNNPTKLGYAGQFIPRKGIDTLLQAITILNDPSISLHIWGKPQDDPYGYEILKQIKDNPSIIYHGPFDANDIENIYHIIDLAIVPSRMENYPLTILEAFAHGTPVIATKVGGIPEIFATHHPDLLVEAGNSEQLAAAIRTALCPETYAVLCASIPQVRNITQDAQDYTKCYSNIISNEDSIQRTRILFYFFKNVHLPILLPLYHAIKAQNKNVEIGFSYLPPSPQIRAGLLPDEVRIIEQTGVPIYTSPQDFHPDLTFIADSVYPWVQGCGKLVHVGHGVLSKGQYYTDTDTARREEAADLICVPGKHHQRIMRSIVSKPVVATGMAKLDALFAGRITRASVLKQYGLPDSYRYVLFAPTFNDELSAIPHVRDRIGEILPDDRTLLIVKLHPSTKAEHKRMYQALPARDQRIIYADELDITPFLALCDVMISDVSSAMMEFAALDKPVILFNSPDWQAYPNYNAADIEFNWRDIGIQVTDLDEMRSAVLTSLQDPRIHADKRRKYTDLLFANKQNGDAAERIVKLALALIEEGRS
jgi:glycosyltransferase involved in cell wall biosynthesis/GT2 family glycosyltransferase